MQRKKQLCKTCVCGVKFYVLPSRAFKKSCSRKCSDTINKPPIQIGKTWKIILNKKCPSCFSEFITPKNHARKYCSARCRYENEEYRKIISERNRLKCFSEITKKKLSLATKKQWLDGRGKIVYGRRPWNKIGDDGVTSKNERIRKSPAYKNWRKSVFERDNYTCVSCEERGGKLNADHIKPFAFYPELRLELSNGRTLCVPCHRETPTWGARLFKSHI